MGARPCCDAGQARVRCRACGDVGQRRVGGEFLSRLLAWNRCAELGARGFWQARPGKSIGPVQRGGEGERVGLQGDRRSEGEGRGRGVGGVVAMRRGRKGQGKDMARAWQETWRRDGKSMAKTRREHGKGPFVAARAKHGNGKGAKGHASQPGQKYGRGKNMARAWQKGPASRPGQEHGTRPAQGLMSMRACLASPSLRCTTGASSSATRRPGVGPWALGFGLWVSVSGGPWALALCALPLGQLHWRWALGFSEAVDMGELLWRPRCCVVLIRLEVAVVQGEELRGLAGMRPE